MKRGFFLSLFAMALVLSSATIPVLAKSQPNPPEIERLTFVHYATPATHPIWDDTEDDYRFIMGGVRWPSPTISFYIDNDVPTNAVNDIIAGFDITWENWSPWTTETPANVFSYGGILSLAASGHDNINAVFWQPLSQGVLGVTYLWINNKEKRIVEFDVVLNSNVTWSAYDVWNIAAHEAGHGLGLNDLKSPKDGALTMYAYSWAGDTGKRTLGKGDYLGLRDLYDI